MIKYIELKTGHHDDGPAWIGRVKASKSGRTIYFNGRALRKGVRGASGKVLIEAAAVEEYLALVGRTELDKTRFTVTHDIKDTDPADFVDFENRQMS